ncbi:hypothetical protein F1D05_06850 [Kribbella qitaiheensis]|uniref:Uncharacterized protein n=1 Tax=Kribbella qitaiheensis TaxID=1544730 RepID=A0A7G6WUK5_9ACTN|nr:hypothetical protein [Kribbella qitaiheensis]QNE17670.1 hypothetical protein F1D05_06850 [Kribbella qitaiheensis]
MKSIRLPLREQFAALLTKLVAAVGEAPDLHADYGRWQLYRVAARDKCLHGVLLEVVEEEPDRVLARAVVVYMLEVVSPDEHPRWIERLQEDEREFAERRSTEWRVLLRAREEALCREEVEAGLDGWTDWLQLRISPYVEAEARAMIEERGRTTRIRQLAKAPANRDEPPKGPS